MLELEKLKEENSLLRAKTENLESAKRVEELYAEAITAMRNYAGYSSMTAGLKEVEDYE